MTLALLLTLWSSAHADSEIRFRTAGPVVVLVDGERATLSGTLDLRARDLEPGPHSVEVQSVLRKTLYKGHLEVADWTVTHASFANGRLEVLKTENMRKARVDRSTALTGSKLEEESLRAPASRDLAAPIPQPDPAVPDEAGVGEPSAIDSIEVSLRDGMTVSVIHGRATVYLSVIDGKLVLTDAHGLELRVGSLD